jgi:LEA14-like dessication related protein
MTKGQKILLGTAIAVPILGYGVYRYIMSHYDFSIGGITVAGQSGSNVKLNILVNITSKIGVQFTVTDIYFDIYMEGYKVGNIYQQENLLIPNNGTAQLQLLANVDTSQISSNIVGMVFSGLQNKGYNITMVGYTHVKIGGLPITTNIAINQGYSLSF